MSKTRQPIPRAFLIASAQDELQERLRTPIAGLPLLDQRTVNALDELGILFVEDLLRFSADELAAVPNFGGATIGRIERQLNELSFSLNSFVRARMTASFTEGALAIRDVEG